MLDKIFQKTTGFIQQPVKAFDAESKTEPMEAFVYMAMVSLVCAILSGIVSLFTPTGLGHMIVGTIVGTYVGIIIISVIAGLWLHFWVYIFGATRGLNQTLKTVFYGGTPFYIFGWIPVIGPFSILWSFYLEWVGLQRLQGMSGDKAAIPILVAFVIPLVILVIIGIFVITMLTSLGILGFPPMGFIPA